MREPDLRADALVVVDMQRALVGGDHAVAEAGAYLDAVAPADPAAHVSRVAEWSLEDTVVAPGHLADVRFVPSISPGG